MREVRFLLQPNPAEPGDPGDETLVGFLGFVPQGETLAQDIPYQWPYRGSDVD
jgi:hypothetical protein